MANFMQYLNINTNLVPSPSTGATSKQVLLIGQRITTGQLYLAQNGFSQPNYYIPLLLPGFQNGAAALNYLSNYGIQSTMGINFTLSLPNPTTVNVNSPVGQTTIIWSAVPSNFNTLTGFALSGSATQSSLSGTIVSASIVSNQAYLVVSGSVAFLTTAGITINGINNIAYPDPILSDPIALMVWDFYQTALSANTAADGVPAAYISILSDRDVTSTPVNTAISLVAPTSVTVSGTTVTLSFAYTGGIATLANFGYLPTTTYGNTTITQATSNATGKFGGYTIAQTSSTAGTVSIVVTNAVGTFNTTNVLSCVLDNTINAFNFLDGIDLHSVVQQFPINTLTNITTTYADFYNGNTTINQANQILNSHYGTYAIAGNTTILPSAAATLPIANDRTKILVSYPYYPQFGDIPYDNAAGTVASGRFSAGVAYMLANGDFTVGYPALTGATINHFPVSSISSTTSYSKAVNGTGNAAVTNGWLPLAPNSAGVVQFLQSNTTMTTLPSSAAQDTEFRFTHIWDCVKYLRRAVAQLYLIISVLPNNQGTVLISPEFLRQFRNGIISILYTAQTYSIVKNVALYEDLVVVTQDATNPNQVDATVPSQIIAQLIGANVNITVFGSLYEF